MPLLVNAYSALRTPVWPDFLPQAAVQHRGHADPELVNHLHGFVGYVNQAGDGQMTQSRYHLMRHVQRVRQHFTFELDDAAFAALAQWAEQANAVCVLADGSVRDPQGRVLISQGELAIDDDAQVPYPPNALQRRAQQLALLTAQGIRVPPSLPPVPGEAEARVRDAAVVSQRMPALFALALRAEMLAAGDTPPSLDKVDARLPASPQRCRRRSAPCSPRLRRTCRRWPTSAGATKGWLCCNGPWALRTRCRNRPSCALCRWPHSVHWITRKPRRTLLPLPELLDALDRHLRLHGAVRQAGQPGQPAVPADIVPGVVYERHYALNWLLHFEDAERDEVDTPT